MSKRGGKTRIKDDSDFDYSGDQPPAGRFVEPTRRRSGKKGELVHVPPDARTKLVTWARTLTEDEGFAIYKSDIMREALDNWFQDRGVAERPCGTMRRPMELPQLIGIALTQYSADELAAEIKRQAPRNFSRS